MKTTQLYGKCASEKSCSPWRMRSVYFYKNGSLYVQFAHPDRNMIGRRLCVSMNYTDIEGCVIEVLTNGYVLGDWTITNQLKEGVNL